MIIVGRIAFLLITHSYASVFLSERENKLWKYSISTRGVRTVFYRWRHSIANFFNLVNKYWQKIEKKIYNVLFKGNNILLFSSNTGEVFVIFGDEECIPIVAEISRLEDLLEKTLLFVILVLFLPRKRHGDLCHSAGIYEFFHKNKSLANDIVVVRGFLHFAILKHHSGRNDRGVPEGVFDQRGGLYFLEIFPTHEYVQTIHSRFHGVCLQKETLF